MRKVHFIAAVLAGVVLATTVNAADLPTIDQLTEKMAKSAADLKTFEADMSNSQMYQGMKVQGNGHLILENSKKDDQAVQKMAMTMKTTVGQKAQEVKIVNDGEFVWTEVKEATAPQPIVIKAKVNKNAPAGITGTTDPAKQMQQMKEIFDLAVTGEDTVGGVKVWVLEGTLRKDWLEKNPQMKDMKAGAAKIKMYIAQDDLFLRRSVAYNDQGQEASQTDFSNIKVNGEVDPKTFVYTPPAGVNVMDLTATPPPGPAPEKK